MYTELVAGMRLKKSTDGTLRYFLGDTDYLPEKLRDRFKSFRFNGMFRSGSCYFDRIPDSKIRETDDCIYLNVGFNIKNYNNEIETFLEWVCPYIIYDGFLGYMRYEENENPTLIYKEDGEIKYVTVNRSNN